MILGPTICRVQAGSQQDIPSIRTQANVVFVPTLVKDKADRPVFGLQATDFTIEDADALCVFIRVWPVAQDAILHRYIRA